MIVDRVAFARICSGRFERDMTVRNVRTGKDVRLTRAMKLFANERESIDVAYAGDVVGLANPGTFAIGDTLAEAAGVRFEPIPAFEPEHFALVRSTDTASYKSFQKGIAQLREEGAIQVLYPYGQTRTEPILAAVGALQFEVVKYPARIGVQREDRDDDAAVHAGAPRQRRRRRGRGGAVAVERASWSKTGTARRWRCSRASGACGSPAEWNPR